MKTTCIFATALVLLGISACSSEEASPSKMAGVVARTTVTVDGEGLISMPNPRQQDELARTLAALPENGGTPAKAGRGVRCMYNCPPPVGSVTAAPQVVDIPAGDMGTTAIHWRWDQSSAQPVTKYSCLWVSAGEEADAHIVQCEQPNHTYTTTLRWIGTGTYTFRVAPGNPNGPFTKPIAVIFQFAQTTVIGIGK